MSRLNEYNPEFGVVFDEIDDAINAALGISGGGGASPKPDAPAKAPLGQALPAGAKPAGAGRFLDNDGIQWYAQSDGTYKPGYAASAAEQQQYGIGPKSGGGGGSAGAKTGGTGGTTYAPKAPVNYAEKNVQDKLSTNANLPGYAQKDALLAGGGKALGNNVIVMPNHDKYSLEAGTGLFRALGQASTADLRAVGSQMMAQSTANRTGGGGTSPVGLPSGTPSSVTDPNARAFTTAPLSGPTYGPPVTPGAPDTRTQSLGPVLNQIAVHNPSNGFNGFINKEEGQRAPFSQGVSPANGSNQILFSQGAHGFTQDENPFGQVSYTTPTTFDTKTGFNDQGFAVPTTFGVTYGTPNYSPDPFGTAGSNTVPLTMAGSNVSFMRPDGSTTGFVRDAMPASNIGLATGRDFSGLNPAAQAAAQFAMLDRQMGGALSNSYRTGEDPNIYGGYGGDFSVADRGFAGGGRVAVRPFTGPVTNPKSMVTPEPMTLIGNYTGHKYALMGEDNADPGNVPNHELLRFSGPQNSNLNITPLEPFAGGGSIQAGPMMGFPMTLQERGQAWQQYMQQVQQRMAREGTLGQSRAFAGGGTIQANSGEPIPTSDAGGPITNPTDPGQQVPPPTGTPNNPDPFPTPTPTTPPEPTAPIPGSQGPVAQYNGPAYTPDPNVLAPWTEAQRQLQIQDAARDAYMYRWKTAGLSGPKAIDVIQGDVPQGELPPSMYYDPSGQVNRVIGEIVGAQSNLQRLGGAEDMLPVEQRATYLGHALDDTQRIRDLELSLVSAGAHTGIDQGAQSAYQAGLEAAQNGLQNLQASGGATPQQLAEAQKAIDFWANLINNPTGGIVTPGSGAGQAQIIQAQIDALKAKLPKDAQGNPIPEADLKTELALLADRKAKNQQRLDLSSQVSNLAKLGVPKLSGPIIPVAHAA